MIILLYQKFSDLLLLFLILLVLHELQDVRQPKLSTAAGIVKKLHDLAGKVGLGVQYFIKKWMANHYSCCQMGLYELLSCVIG